MIGLNPGSDQKDAFLRVLTGISGSKHVKTSICFLINRISCLSCQKSFSAESMNEERLALPNQTHGWICLREGEATDEPL